METYQKRLKKLDAAAARVTKASKEEILQYVRFKGRDPMKEAAQLRNLMLAAIRRHRVPAKKAVAQRGRSF